MVAVHAKVPAPNTGDLGTAGQRLHQLLHVAERGGGEGVAPIQHRVNGHTANTFALCELHERNQVVLVRVDPTVTNQPDQVQRPLAGLGVGAGIPEGGISEEIPRFDGERDPHEILHHHPAGPEVQVADLTVAHLPFGESNR